MDRNVVEGAEPSLIDRTTDLRSHELPSYSDAHVKTGLEPTCCKRFLTKRCGTIVSSTLRRVDEEVRLTDAEQVSTLAGEVSELCRRWRHPSAVEATISSLRDEGVRFRTGHWDVVLDYTHNTEVEIGRAHV